MVQCLQSNKINKNHLLHLRYLINKLLLRKLKRSIELFLLNSSNIYLRSLLDKHQATKYCLIFRELLHLTPKSRLLLRKVGTTTHTSVRTRLQLRSIIMEANLLQANRITLKSLKELSEKVEVANPKDFKSLRSQLNLSIKDSSQCKLSSLHLILCFLQAVISNLMNNLTH
jgi:hypothetical protein